MCAGGTSSQKDIAILGNFLLVSVFVDESFQSGSTQQNVKGYCEFCRCKAVTGSARFVSLK